MWWKLFPCLQLTCGLGELYKQAMWKILVYVKEAIWTMLSLSSGKYKMHD